MCKGLERINFVFCLSPQDLTRISGESWKRNLRIATIKLFVVETICLKNVLKRLINMLVNLLLDMSEKAPLSGRRQRKRVSRVAYNLDNQKLQESKNEWHEAQPYNWNFCAAKTNKKKKQIYNTDNAIDILGKDRKTKIIEDIFKLMYVNVCVNVCMYMMDHI